jgi:hypothetical protein
MRIYLPKKLSHGKTFTKMLNNCYKYAKSINTKGQPFPAEAIIIALLFSQHKMIEWLEGQISKPKINTLKPLDQSINGSTIDDVKGAYSSHSNLPMLLLDLNLGNRKASFALSLSHALLLFVVLLLYPPTWLPATLTYS